MSRLRFLILMMIVLTNHHSISAQDIPSVYAKSAEVFCGCLGKEFNSFSSDLKNLIITAEGDAEKFQVNLVNYAENDEEKMNAILKEMDQLSGLEESSKECFLKLQQEAGISDEELGDDFWSNLFTEMKLREDCALVYSLLVIGATQSETGTSE